ncbi:MAG: trypsin-like peptidase domain-containing protein [bacterium]|nr:trypsin-like peptidase domain-containing protein [bacterium]
MAAAIKAEEASGTGFILKYHAWFEPVRHFYVTAWHVVETDSHDLPSLEDLGLSPLLPGWSYELEYLQGIPEVDLAFISIAGFPAPHYLLWDWGELQGGETVSIPGVRQDNGQEYAWAIGTVKDVGISVRDIIGWPGLQVECFRVDVQVRPSMSGAPVLFRGHVVGVVIASGNGETLAVCSKDLRWALSAHASGDWIAGPNAPKATALRPVSTFSGSSFTRWDTLADRLEERMREVRGSFDFEGAIQYLRSEQPDPRRCAMLLQSAGLSSEVRFRTVMEGATVKYRLAEIAGAPKTAHGLTNDASSVLSIGTYYVWAERNGIPTSRTDNEYDIIRNVELVVIEEDQMR